MEYSAFAAEHTPFPAELLTRAQWILWRGQEERTRQGTTKLNKIPINPQTLSKASTTNPRTWASYLYCIKALPAALEEWQADDPDSPCTGGVGFVFAADDPYVGIDLDHCREPQSGVMQPWAAQLARVFHTYTELSPSHTGVHLLGQGTVGQGLKRGPIEVYDRGRYFTVTGAHLPDTPRTLEAVQQPLNWLLASIEVLAKALDRHGERFSRLFAGEWSGTYPSQSEADLALCRLAGQCGATAAQCDALVRVSGLYRPKWDEHHGSRTYGQLTRDKALQGQRAPVNGQSPHRHGTTPEPEAASRWPYRELPEIAAVDEDLAQGACLWLDDYVQTSRTWSPWAYEGFHEAVGLWVLATVAARRLKIRFGPAGLYPSLYLALVARSSLYAKTTTVSLGMALLRQAGLDWLLADDDATPQAFVRSLTLQVPPDYDGLSPDEQARIQQQLAFTAQRGWFFEEWGQHLEAMMRREGFMGAFRSMLRRLDDHPSIYAYNTISRGRDRLVKPYLALLANATPADLYPFARARSPLWRDGYIARIAFIAPGLDTPPIDARFPEGDLTHPARTVTALRTWHERLGLPQATIETTEDDATQYRATLIQTLPETVYTLHAEVREALYRYLGALRTLLADVQSENLDPCYIRLPGRALRIAALLTSLNGTGGTVIHLPQWARAQQIVERWRRDLHHLIDRVEGERQTEDDRLLRKEHRLMAILRQGGWYSLRDLHVATKFPLQDLQDYCDLFVKQGMVASKVTTRTVKYHWEEEAERETSAQL